MEHKTSFDVSSISKIENGGNVKAIANVVVNGELAVRGVKVVEGEKGAFVAMPSKKMGRDYADVAFPITAEARTALNNAVLKSYEQLMSSPEKTLKTEVPAAEQSKSSVNVQLRPVDNNSLKAAGQVTIDGCFVVKDVKVMTGSENKPFVSMPSYQTKTGDYEQWVIFFLQALSDSAGDAIQTIDALTALHNQSVARLGAFSKRQQTNLLKLFAYIETNPIIDIQKTAAALGLSYNTVSKMVTILVDEGILWQTDKAGKAKIYSYADYLDILRKDT